MRVQIATQADFDSWLDLAREVEPLFGPMVGEPAFHAALEAHLERESAFCVREGDGSAGAALLAGMLLTNRPGEARIDWLAVAERARGHGLGALLVGHGMALIAPPATVTVVTFGPDNIAGLPARRLYERFGFIAAEMAQPGPEGESRQVFRLNLSARSL